MSSSNDPTKEDLSSLFIPEAQLHGTMSLAETAAHLNMTPAEVTERLSQSLVYYEASDKRRWYEPGSVERCRQNIADWRKVGVSGAERERQKLRDDMSRDIQRAQQPTPKKKGKG